MNLQVILWGASIIAAIGAGVAIWSAVMIRADGERRRREKPLETRKEPNLQPTAARAEALRRLRRWQG
jgi:hypothetical protein